MVVFSLLISQSYLECLIFFLQVFTICTFNLILAVLNATNAGVIRLIAVYVGIAFVVVFIAHDEVVNLIIVVK